MRVCSPHCGLDAETTSGGETYEREMLTRLARLGMVCDLILARHKGIPEDAPNLVVHRLPIGRGLRWPVAAALLPRYIARVYRRVRFDLLRVHSLRYIGPAALAARRFYGIDVPIVSHHHHLDPNWLNSIIERRVVLASERLITGSDFSKRQLVEVLGIPADHVEVVPYGVDERFAPREVDSRLRDRLGLTGEPLALFFGGLKPRKNLFFLLDAWRDVATARPRATLLVAGGGPLESALRRRSETLGLTGRVVFVGRVPEAEKVAYYNVADVFLFPSLLEGFGLAVGEAMSCGLPAVVSDQGSLPELVVDGQGGFVCRGQDRGEFVRAVLRLLDDAALRRRFGAFNRARIDQHFRWHRASRRVLDIYEEILGDWKRGVRRP